jgi:hypothetical protein
LRGKDRQDPLRVWADAVAARRGKKIAVIALARRMVGVLSAMWRDGSPYNKARLASASGRGTRQSASALDAHAKTMTSLAGKPPTTEAMLQT